MSKNAIFVRSTAHTPIVLTEPNPNPEKPGDAPPLRSVTINASGRPGVPAVTKLEGDDAEAFSAWAKANKNGDLLRGEILTLGSDDDEDGEIEWGHEVFLEGAEGSGSTEEAPAGRVKSSRMTPKGPGKPNDGSGEPRHASQPGEKEPKKTDASDGPKDPAKDAAKSADAGKDAEKK